MMEWTLFIISTWTFMKVMGYEKHKEQILTLKGNVSYFYIFLTGYIPFARTIVLSMTFRNSAKTLVSMIFDALLITAPYFLAQSFFGFQRSLPIILMILVLSVYMRYCLMLGRNIDILCEAVKRNNEKVLEDLKKWGVEDGDEQSSLVFLNIQDKKSIQ